MFNLKFKYKDSGFMLNIKNFVHFRVLTRILKEGVQDKDFSKIGSIQLYRKFSEKLGSFSKNRSLGLLSGG